MALMWLTHPSLIAPVGTLTSWDSFELGLFPFGTLSCWDSFLLGLFPVGDSFLLLESIDIDLFNQRSWSLPIYGLWVSTSLESPLLSDHSCAEHHWGVCPRAFCWVCVLLPGDLSKEANYKQRHQQSSKERRGANSSTQLLLPFILHPLIGLPTNSIIDGPVVLCSVSLCMGVGGLRTFVGCMCFISCVPTRHDSHEHGVVV